MPRTAVKIGPRSQRNVLASLDGRGEVALKLKKIRNALTVALGDQLTPGQALIVDSCAFKILRCQMLANRLLIDENATDTTVKNYTWLSNSARRDIIALGLDEKRVDEDPSLGELLRAAAAV